MKIETKDPKPTFRPIVITLETRKEAIDLLRILGSVGKQVKEHCDLIRYPENPFSFLAYEYEAQGFDYRQDKCDRTL